MFIHKISPGGGPSIQIDQMDSLSFIRGAFRHDDDQTHNVLCISALANKHIFVF